MDADADLTPTMAGWLHKRGRKRKNWKKRWFCLQGGKLTYYSKEGGQGQAKGAMNIAESAISVSGGANGAALGAAVPEGGRPFFFAVWNDFRVLHLAAADATELLSWRRALRGMSPDGDPAALLRPGGTSSSTRAVLLAARRLAVARTPLRAFCSAPPLGLAFAAEGEQPSAVLAGVAAHLVAAHAKKVATAQRKAAATGTDGRDVEEEEEAPIAAAELHVGSLLMSVAGVEVEGGGAAVAVRAVEAAAFPMELTFEEAPQMRGVLKLRARTTGLLARSWRWDIREVVVRAGKLRYYEPFTGEAAPKGEMALRGANVSLWLGDGEDDHDSDGAELAADDAASLRSSCLMLAGCSADRLVLQATTESDCIEWAALLKYAIKVADGDTGELRQGMPPPLVRAPPPTLTASSLQELETAQEPEQRNRRTKSSASSVKSSSSRRSHSSHKSSKSSSSKSRSGGGGGSSSKKHRSRTERGSTGGGAAEGAVPPLPPASEGAGATEETKLGGEEVAALQNAVLSRATARVGGDAEAVALFKKNARALSKGVLAPADFFRYLAAATGSTSFACRLCTDLAKLLPEGGAALLEVVERKAARRKGPRSGSGGGWVWSGEVWGT